MSKNKETWNNFLNYNKGKEKLKNAVLQHPDEDTNTSMYSFMKKNINRRLWVNNNLKPKK